MEIVGWFFFVLFLLIGVAVIPFGIAGTFIIVADVLVFAWLTNFEVVTWKFLGIMLGISVFVEALEFFLGAAAAKKYGASTWGIWGAILGGFFGAVWGTAVSPILGTIFGAFVGAFLGAYLFEFLRNKDSQQAFRAGWGAFIGTVTGRFFKLLASVLMLVLIGHRIL